MRFPRVSLHYRKAPEKLTRVSKSSFTAPPQILRRAFSFNPEESRIYLMRFRGKRRFIRFDGGGEQGARSHFYANLIFNALYPKNSIRPVAVASMDVKGKEYWGVISNIVKGRSIDYKRYQRGFYSSKKPIAGDSKHADAHKQFVAKVAVPVRYDILDKTGIELNDHFVNIAEAGGQPVFFEVHRINFSKLKEFVGTLPNEKRRSALFKLIAKLEFIDSIQAGL